MDQQSTAPEVSIVLPCLNEASTVGICVQKALVSLKSLGLDGEVVVADNGSTDGSDAIARTAGARVVSVTERGYGSALLGGIVASRGRWVIMADADGQHDLSSLGGFIEKLKGGYDLVMGNRFQGGIGPGAMPALHRYFGNPLLSLLGRLFFKSPVGDFHCGMRGFDREAMLGLDLQTTGMEFASEMIVKATLNGLRICEVPTTLSPARRERLPHLRTWRDGWRHLRFLLLYSPRWLFLIPGLVLMVLGLGISIWLLPGPARIGRIGFDIQTLLLAATMIVVGFQSVLFAVLTKIFAITEGLLPEDPRINWALRYVTLETGILAGLLLVTAGLAGVVYAFLRWSTASFGALNASNSLRIAIPSASALTLGFQILLFSFFLSILGLRRR